MRNAWVGLAFLTGCTLGPSKLGCEKQEHCVQGYECRNGTCQPIGATDAWVKDADAAVEDVDSPTSRSGLYYASIKSVYRYRPGEDQDEFIVSAPNIVQGLAFDDDYDQLYVTTWSTFYKFDLNTQAQETLSESNAGYQGIIHSASRRVFWGEYYAGLFEAHGSGYRTVVLGARLAPGHGVSGLAYDEAPDHIYFLSRHDGGQGGADCTVNGQAMGRCGRKIWRVNSDGTDLLPILTLGDASTLSLDLDNREIYFGDRPFEQGRQQIWRTKLDGTTPRLVAEVPLEVLAGLLVVPSDGIYISSCFRSSNKHCALHRISFDGGPVTELRVLDGVESFGALTYVP